MSNEQSSEVVERGRALIIDDSRDARELFALLLRKLGFDARSAPSGRTGLAAASEFQPQVIFCDLTLDVEMSGFQVARAVRADPQLAWVNLVAVTGHVDAESRDKALAAGFDRVLTKPVAFDQLREVAERY